MTYVFKHSVCLNVGFLDSADMTIYIILSLFSQLFLISGTVFHCFSAVFVQLWAIHL